MIETLTFLVQLLILATVGWTSWSIYRSGERMKRTSTLIEQYRREIGWLTERVDMLEQQRGVVKYK